MPLFVNDHFEFAEMNIRHTKSVDKTMSMVRRAIKMGYDSIVINTDIGALSPDFGDRGCESLSKKMRKRLKRQNIIPDPVVIDTSALDTSWLEANGKHLRLFSRLTVTISDSSEVHSLKSDPQVQKYDLIAVRPADEQILQIFSKKGEFIDIITYDQASRSVNWLNKSKIIQLCINDGITFEITYGEALKDSSTRREVLKNGRLLIRSTKNGDGVVIASGAEAMIDIRAPYDAANMLVLFGVRPENARKFISSNAKKALLRSETRNTVKGSVLASRVQKMPENLSTRLNSLQKIKRIPEFCTELKIVNQ
ncbi:unnamed protein product [Thelazia callipaeda]|uniref:Rpp30 n=1 Tax=Thelazia callipaeda TaxID=103827 RepID=A0A0N5D0K4_THECL|nr:unnamed protein product [Thelazia callipaeda]